MKFARLTFWMIPHAELSVRDTLARPPPLAALGDRDRLLPDLLGVVILQP